MSNATMEKVNALIESTPAMRSWLTHVQNVASCSYDLYRFCEYVKLSPTQLLALKDNPADKTAEQLLDQFIADEKAGFIGERGFHLFRNSVKCRISANVKSYFKWNYRDLARVSGNITLEKVKPTNLPTKANLRKLWDYCLSPRDRSLVTFVASTAIAKGSIVQLKWSHFEQDWEKADYPCLILPASILKGHGRGKYKGVQQITFLTPEAKRDLLTYREWIQQKIGRMFTPDDNIFFNSCEPFKPLDYGHLGNIIQTLSHDAKVAFSWHDARRYVNTALEQIAISQNWAHKIRGRKVRGEEAPYSRPAVEQLRAKFVEAVPLLQFTVEQKVAMPPEVQERLKALEDQQRTIKRQYGIYTRKNVGKPKITDESDEPQPTESDDKKPNCTDGAHCPEFKQVSEDALLAYLKAGWQIEHNLSNGQVIIRRE